MTIELSIPTVVALTSNSNTYVYSKDDPNTCIVGPIFPSEFEEPNLEANNFEGLDFDNDFVDFPTGKRKKIALVGAKVMEELVKVNSNRWEKI